MLLPLPSFGGPPGGPPPPAAFDRVCKGVHCNGYISVLGAALACGTGGGGGGGACSTGAGGGVTGARGAGGGGGGMEVLASQASWRLLLTWNSPAQWNSSWRAYRALSACRRR